MYFYSKSQAIYNMTDDSWNEKYIEKDLCYSLIDCQ